ncbi:hypothetical protein PCC7424_4454 [Gloeothece citriformis PCC 7424]|uniref:DUF5678 domain-containing protein n=1 Tax=Gloeothece citriformis (strain PCC 7424) TaxID=65393 RepID=B7K949_GLOC7|nr:hypothetical protein [Gloeothece citriformis]ACK72818.1 hypothetical protein PCC7424_4454 [Gloeothece citriformis PCC 7424]
MVAHNTNLENSPEVDEKIRKIAEEAIEQDKLTEEQEEKLKNLYFQYVGEEEYYYGKRQEESFNKNLPELIKNYSGMYVWFEDGQVMDYDADEDVLLDRIYPSERLKSRTINAIYVREVPQYIP